MSRSREVGPSQTHVGIDAFRVVVSQRPNVQDAARHHTIITSGVDLYTDHRGALVTGSHGGVFPYHARHADDVQWPEWPFCREAVISPYDLSGKAVPGFLFRLASLPAEIARLLPAKTETKKGVAPFSRLALIDVVTRRQASLGDVEPSVMLFNHHNLLTKTWREGDQVISSELVVLGGLGRIEIGQSGAMTTLIYRKQPLSDRLAFPSDKGWFGLKDTYEQLVARRKAYEQRQQERQAALSNTPREGPITAVSPARV